jgi:DNA polymerase III subunit gamma/tau
MGVLTRKYRPHVFETVVGQDLAVKLLKAVAKKPSRSANSLVLSGPWGTGKTTLARVFGRALSCENFLTTGRICMKCSGCRNWDKLSNRYIEYDSSMVGNVQQIRELKPVFEMVTEFYRVIVLDEAHLISRQAQSSMLKVIEEGPPKTFFVLCSTDPDMILDTIHSRSLPVDLYKVGNAVIVDHLKNIYKNETGKDDISPDVLERIAFKCDGHVRDAVMLLEGYMVSEDESVLDLPIDDIRMFFDMVSKGEREQAIAVVSKGIMRHPVHQIQKSLNYVVMQMVASHVRKGGNYLEIAQRLNLRVYDIFKIASDSWSQGVFKDKYLTASFFLTLVNQFTNRR